LIRSKEIVATGLAVPEGPVLLPDGSVAFVEQVKGRVSLYDGSTVRSIAEFPGSPNAVTYGSDGCLYAAQNGGVVGGWRSDTPAMPGIQRISISGAVEYVTNSVDGLATKAPNDLVFGPDGRLYFTDPSEGYSPAARVEHGKLFAIGQGRDELVIDVGMSYPNGLAFFPDGRLVWVETYEREVCVLEDGIRRVLCKLPEHHLPDGLDVATDGRLFITTVTSHGITVVSPEGEFLELMYFDESALPTNCCFDGRALWVTDFSVGWDKMHTTGRLWRIETDAIGKKQVPGMIG
jgi:gluconolactonase